MRYSWHELPPAVRAEVEGHTGPALRTTPVLSGSISDVAVVLVTDTGHFFCKGAATDNPMGWMHRNEARWNPHLPPQVPRLLWQFERHGWLMLGFEYVAGRHPDLSPGSPDLNLLATTLTTMATALTPCPEVKVQTAAVRWADYLAPEAVDGNTLVHTDVTPHNFLLDGGSIKVVDWSMPCRGAAWIDTALMVVRLIRAGHSPAQAEAWADRIPAWSTAPSGAVDAFATGIAALSLERHQQRPSAAHLGPLATAAASWARHRATTIG
ncbi:phosphotransferase [Actinoplanes sp. M2I2]|uniref:phosphotransferase n=1 Tax=Actinoplanes sp. M2I2 TaxID=1734444 RepID=UPI00202228E4|nr:phosphotransferase [Actinoplanes sp. M2I2]